jgi:hypothetical protein
VKKHRYLIGCYSPAQADTLARDELTTLPYRRYTQAQREGFLEQARPIRGRLWDAYVRWCLAVVRPAVAIERAGARHRWQVIIDHWVFWDLIDPLSSGAVRVFAERNGEYLVNASHVRTHSALEQVCRQFDADPDVRRFWWSVSYSLARARLSGERDVAARLAHQFRALGERHLRNCIGEKYLRQYPESELAQRIRPASGKRHRRRAKTS